MSEAESYISEPVQPPILERLRSALEHEHAKALGAHQATINTIKQHIPSLSDEDEDLIIERMADDPDGNIADPADLALRTCHCGAKIDGFYEYAGHLIAVLGGESTMEKSKRQRAADLLSDREIDGILDAHNAWPVDHEEGE